MERVEYEYEYEINNHSINYVFSKSSIIHMIDVKISLTYNVIRREDE